MSRRMRAVPVYLTYLTCSGFFFQMMSVVFSLFLILRLDLGPFQLVLLGTILEGTYLVASAALQLPSLLLYRRAIRKGTVGTLAQDEMDPVLDLEDEPV